MTSPTTGLPQAAGLPQATGVQTATGLPPASGGAAPWRESAVRARVAALEDLLGDPSDPANPAGYGALLEADRAEVPFARGEALLDDFGIVDEYVPRSLGGRLDAMDTLVRVLRPVMRRDVGLAIGHGMTTFMAASDVWTVGSDRQREWLAGLLRAGGRAAIAQHETAHSNDFVRSQVTARRGSGGGYVISGGKPMINNLERAGALVLFCRTDPAPGSRSHSVLLLGPDQLSDARAAVTGRRMPVGLRGCRFGAVEFDDCPVPESALLGPEGSGIETALRSFQISRTVFAATAVAALDTSLRTAVRIGREQTGGWHGRATDGSRTGAAVTNAFVSLLLYDALAVVASRALHLLPAETSVSSAALKYLMPRILTESMYDLSIVLGSDFYTREGTLGIFQKHVRDLPLLTLGHAGTVACQATVIPQMPRLARRSWFVEEEAPAGLFRLDGDLPPLRSDRLALACGRDSLSASLLAVAARIEGHGPVERVLRTLAGLLVEEFRDVRGRVLGLEAASGSSAQPARFALMDRYTLLLAAAAVLGVWDQARYGSDPFLADPCWAAAALHRICGRLGTRVPDLPPECETRIRHEVQLRFSTRTSYDLYSTPIPG